MAASTVASVPSDMPDAVTEEEILALFKPEVTVSGDQILAQVQKELCPDACPEEVLTLLFVLVAAGRLAKCCMIYTLTRR